MSYGLSAALQRLFFAALTDDVQGSLGVQVFDLPPSGVVPEVYVLLGPENVRDVSDVSARRTLHRCIVSVICAEAGFSEAKEIAAEVVRRVEGANRELHEEGTALGRVTDLRFESASARRADKGGTRRIDLKILARLEAIAPTEI